MAWSFDPAQKFASAPVLKPAHFRLTLNDFSAFAEFPIFHFGDYQ
jgi:hypothetical protein